MFAGQKGYFGTLGVLAYDPVKDKVQCHVCAHWYRGLNNHIRRHGYNVASYQAKFGLNRKQSLVSEGTRQKLRDLNQEQGNWKQLVSQTLNKEQLAQFFQGIRQPRGWKHREQALLRKSKNLLEHNPMNNPVSQTISRAKLRHTWYGTDRQIEQSKASFRKMIATIRTKNITQRRYVCCGQVFAIREDLRKHRLECHRDGRMKKRLVNV